MTYTQRMLGEVGARRALVVEPLRRVLTIYTDWAGADPAVGAVFAATAAALPERVPDKLRAKLGKQLASATKAAQKAAGYDRRRGVIATPPHAPRPTSRWRSAVRSRSTTPSRPSRSASSS